MLPAMPRRRRDAGDQRVYRDRLLLASRERIVAPSRPPTWRAPSPVETLLDLYDGGGLLGRRRLHLRPLRISSMASHDLCAGAIDLLHSGRQFLGSGRDFLGALGHVGGVLQFLGKLGQVLRRLLALGQSLRLFGHGFR
jgi:hypothetical protein